ncbi:MULTISPECIES: transglutaminase domain-containing protein [unclassified Blautia]|uniref:transglutaminase domain-containing protein n=1 Tax=unclassified Blautia TaxID=2648079 RepID=UPI003F8A02C7
MKKIKILLGIAMVVSVLTIPVHGAEGDTAIPVISEIPQITPVETPVRELRVEGNKIFYYYKGKMVRNKWKRYEGYKYYFGEDGYAYIGGSKIGNKAYVFDENGHLLENQKGKMRTVLNKKYCIASDNGQPKTGYFIYHNDLYYADSKGRCYQNRTREDGQLYFTSSGKARKDTNALLKMRVMNLVSRLTTSEMSKNQKLHACWEYIVDDAGFQYGGSDPDLKKAGWCRKTALSMLNTKVGNCYGFASTLAAFAKELGYKKIELIDGRIPGTRDHAPDGFTGHCWVRIDNRYYDPEADWAGWMTGVYGYSSYPIRHYVKKVYNFMR